MAFPLTAIFSIGEKLIDRLIPDKQAKADATLKLLTLQQNGDLANLAAETDLAKGQIEVNKIEASSDKLFVAGWRPAIGWLCGAILATNYMIVPLLAWLSPALSLPPPDRLDMGELMYVLLGMLGLGGMRSAEKMKGVA